MTRTVSSADGATVTEMVKSMRKVLTVVLSFILYPKEISYKVRLRSPSPAQPCSRSPHAASCV